MAAAKVIGVSIDPEYSCVLKIEPKKPSNSSVKALIHLEAVQRSDQKIHIPVAVVLDVAKTRGFTSKTEMWELILGEFRRAGRNDDIIVIDGNIRTTSMSDLISSPQDNPMAKGITELKPVLKKAIEKLEKGRSSSVVATGQRGFIMLVSDGGSEFSKADEDDKTFRKDLSGYPVHAFALGFVGNNNEDQWKALHSIVTISKGTFSYIPVTDDREKLERDVVRGMASCVAGLATVVAMDMRVTISVTPMGIESTTWGQTTNSNIQDLKIEKIQSGGYDSSITLKNQDREGELRVGYLSDAEAKDLIVHVAFKSDGDSSRTQWFHLAATVHYYDYDSSSGSQKKQTAKCNKKFTVERTRDQASFKEYTQSKQPNLAVLEQMMIRSDVLPMLLSFAKGFQGGSKAAGDLLTDWGNKLKQERGNLQMAARLQKSSRGRVDLIKGIEMDIQAMASSLEGGLGLGCIYSWVSRQQMQRDTTMSLPPPSPAFQTPAMEEAARNVRDHYLAAAKVPEAPPLGGPAAAAGSSSSRTTRNNNKKVPPTAAQPALDDDTKPQRANGLFDELFLLFKEDKNSSSGGKHRSKQQNSGIADAWILGNQILEAVEAAINGTRMTTRRATTPDDHDLKDVIKSTIAIWLFDRILELKEGRDDLRPIMLKIYEVAQKAIEKWEKNL